MLELLDQQRLGRRLGLKRREGALQIAREATKIFWIIGQISMRARHAEG